MRLRNILLVVLQQSLLILPGTEPTSLSTPPLTIASGSGAVYPYPLSTTALEQRVHELINQERAENGLGTLGL